MPFCRNCGTSVREEDRFCARCGAMQFSTPTAPPNPIPKPQPAKKNSYRRFGGLFIFSLIHLILLFPPTGILALFYTFRAEEAKEDVTARKHRKTAWLINIIATAAVGIIAFALFIIGIVLSIMTSFQAGGQL